MALPAAKIAVNGLPKGMTVIGVNAVLAAGANFAAHALDQLAPASPFIHAAAVTGIPQASKFLADKIHQVATKIQEAIFRRFPLWKQYESGKLSANC